MFAAQRWARAFLDACAGNTEDGLAAFKAFAEVLGQAGGGGKAAKRFQELAEASLDAAGLTGAKRLGPAAACRTIGLLLSKGFGRHIPAVAREAEKVWEAENGILAVTVDVAFPPESHGGAAFLDKLAAALREKTGSREVRLTTRLMPELIGGCRLRAGSECLDASLRGQLHKMAADLSAAGGSAW